MRSIIDGNSLLFRAFYGVHQRLTRPDGTPTNAAFGFCNMVLPLVAAASSDDEFICVFDAHRKNWRNDIYPEYKMNRDETPPDLIAQIEITRGAVRAMGMPCLILPDVEADDVIATLCQDQCPTRIISSDKDLMQLIGPCVFMLDTMKDALIREAGVFEKFGVRPDQVVDCQALIGDSSDNIPGVHGIGPKKAAELINEFGTLANIYENLDKIGGRTQELLAAGRDMAFMSQTLARLKTDVPLPPIAPFKFDAAAAADYFMHEIGSSTLAEKARKLAGHDAPIAPPARPDSFAFDLADYEIESDLFSEKKTIESVWPTLTNPAVLKIGRDWKTVFHALDAAGFDVSKINPIEDTMLREYAADSTPSIYEMDLAILRPLFQMEKNGILVDREKLAEISERLHADADALQSKIWALADTEFNIASPKQLAEILFDKLGLPTDKKRSTDADKLESLDSDIARAVLEWRTLSKLSGTYADALPKQIAADGRIHTTFLQTSTNTGRLSSVNPNLQNIPIRSAAGAEIRSCFVAAKNHVLISADYSQIQLRLLAHLADEPVLKDAFNAGRDIHEETACKIFGHCDGTKRALAKTINFSIIYGISPFGLAGQLGMSQSEAALIIKQYMDGLPRVATYFDGIKKFAAEHGYVDTPLGRRIKLGQVYHNPHLLRAAINAPIQGFEADIMRIAMARLAAAGLNAKMVLQVHDEFVFEAPADSADATAKKIIEIMQNAAIISVPLKAEYHISDRWEK